MARKRTIDQDKLLDAAERVVARDGAVKLTLEAVAVEAGVSKASVLYDHKTKQALVQAVIERAIKRDNEFNNACSKSLSEPESSVIRGRIVAATNPLPDEIKAVALNLCAALALEESFRQLIQKNQADVIQNIASSSSNPRGGLLAYLALEGLKLLESLDYHSWQKSERDQILREINWLVGVTPQEVALPESSESL